MAGRAFRDPNAKIAESRSRVDALLAKCARRCPKKTCTAFEIVAELVGPENLGSPISAWAMQIVIACLDHLALKGEETKDEVGYALRWNLA